MARAGGLYEDPEAHMVLWDVATLDNIEPPYIRTLLAQGVRLVALPHPASAWWHADTDADVYVADLMYALPPVVPLLVAVAASASPAAAACLRVVFVDTPALGSADAVRTAVNATLSHGDNTRSHNQVVPLAAARRGDVVDALVAAGAHVHAPLKLNGYFHADLVAKSVWDGRTEVTARLVAHGASMNGGPFMLPYSDGVSHALVDAFFHPHWVPSSVRALAAAHRPATLQVLCDAGALPGGAVALAVLRRRAHAAARTLERVNAASAAARQRKGVGHAVDHYWDVHTDAASQFAQDNLLLRCAAATLQPDGSFRMLKSCCIMYTILQSFRVDEPELLLPALRQAADVGAPANVMVWFGYEDGERVALLPTLLQRWRKAAPTTLNLATTMAAARILLDAGADVNAVGTHADHVLDMLADEATVRDRNARHAAVLSRFFLAHGAMPSYLSVARRLAMLEPDAMRLPTSTAMVPYMGSAASDSQDEIRNAAWKRRLPAVHNWLRKEAPYSGRSRVMAAHQSVQSARATAAALETDAARQRGRRLLVVDDAVAAEAAAAAAADEVVKAEAQLAAAQAARFKQETAAAAAAAAEVASVRAAVDAARLTGVKRRVSCPPPAATSMFTKPPLPVCMPEKRARYAVETVDALDALADAVASRVHINASSPERVQ